MEMQLYPPFKDECLLTIKRNERIEDSYICLGDFFVFFFVKFVHAQL